MTVANVPYFTLNNGRIFHQSELGENSCTSYIVFVMLIELLCVPRKGAGLVQQEVVTLRSRQY